jgi:hypothetical protein
MRVFAMELFTKLVALNWMAAGVSIIPDGLKHDGSVLRLSPNSKGSQHNEQARSFLRAGVRQLPCDHTTGESKSLMHKSVYQRFDFETGSVLLYDRIGEYRPDNVRIHVDLKHYLIGSTADPQCTADDIEQKWENAAALGDFRHATELCFSTDCGSSLHSPVPLLDATRLKFCSTRVADTAKRLLAAYSGREVANAKTDRPLRRMITLLRVDVGSVGKKHRFKNRFSLFFSNGTLG